MRNEGTTVSSEPTLVGNQKLASAFKRILDPLVKNMEKGVKDAIKSGMKDVARSTSAGKKTGGQGGTDQNAAFAKVMDSFSRRMSSLFNELYKQIESGTSPEQVNTIIRKAIREEINRSIDNVTKSTGTKLPEKQRQQFTEKAVNAAMDKYASSMGEVVTKIGVAVQQLKTLTEKATKGGKDIKGGIESGSITNVVTAALKNINVVSETIKTKEVLKELKTVNKELAQQQKEIAKDISDGMRSLRSTVSSRATSAKKAILNDPASGTIGIVESITSSLRKIPGVSEDKNFKKVLDAVDTKTTSLKDAVDKIDQLGKILEKAVSSKSAKADDIKAFGNLLNELKDAIGKFSGSSRTIDNPNLSKEALKTIEELSLIHI